MDYGKHLYEQKRNKNWLARNKEKLLWIKEIQFRPQQELEIGKSQSTRVSDDGDKVKLVMKLRGRENAMKDFAMEHQEIC